MARILLLLLCFPLVTIAQNEQAVENRLLQLFDKIKAYDFDNPANDSLGYYNEKFEEALSDALQANTNTINYPFKKLQDAGLQIKTSADKKLRVYCWDDMQGGTMRYINNVTQIQNNRRQTVTAADDDGYIPSIDTMVANGKTYYLLTRTLKGSSALFLHLIEVYTINGKEELVNAPVIKTTQHFTNKLSCEADYSADANRYTDDFIASNITYNVTKREIVLPLILENGKITRRKIIYRFNGKHFVKSR